MPYLSGIGLLIFALWLFCVIDVIVSDEWAVRQLPKTGWLIIVTLLPTVGSLAWLIAGRPERAPVSRPSRSPYPEYDRPGRHIATDPDDDEEFLRRCRERAEQQRQVAREQRAAREREENA